MPASQGNWNSSKLQALSSKGYSVVYSNSTITVSATVEERAFQAGVQMQNKWASAPVPRGTVILELL